MNKSDLITLTAQRTGLSKKDADLAVNTIVETISQTLIQGERVQLSGFGSFEVKERLARVGRNPHTGETIDIPASKLPVFKPSKALKEAVDK